MSFLANGFTGDLAQNFLEILTLLKKIEKWWIINYEIPLNPDLIGEEIDEDGILPGSVTQLIMMMDIAVGSDEQAQFYINNFIEKGIFKPSGEV